MGTDRARGPPRSLVTLLHPEYERAIIVVGPGHIKLESLIQVCPYPKLQTVEAMKDQEK